MAGFEGPRDPDGQDPGGTKLPSWAVTRKDAEPDLSDPVEPPALAGFADVGLGTDPARGQRAAAPVVRVPEHPFDVDDPFGDKQLGGVSSPWIRPPADDTEVRVVDLADEFHLTTAQALEVCEVAGAPATSGAAWLTAEQADAFRSAVADYDRSASSDETFPDWAVPPGGRRDPTRTPATGTAAGGRAPSGADPADEGISPGDPGGASRSGPGVLRIVVAVVLLVAVLAVVAFLVTR